MSYIIIYIHIEDCDEKKQDDHEVVAVVQTINVTHAYFLLVISKMLFFSSVGKLSNTIRIRSFIGTSISSAFPLNRLFTNAVQAPDERHREVVGRLLFEGRNRIRIPKCFAAWRFMT